jgi:hypothetical protein
MMRLKAISKTQAIRNEGTGMAAKKVRYLTKTRFKEAWECPAKLYYSGKPEYGNQKLEDAFLQALAEGGFQVGKLAQHYHPGGLEIETLKNEEAIQQTSELMKQKKITLFEAAITHGSLLARVDILVKTGRPRPREWCKSG